MKMSRIVRIVFAALLLASASCASKYRISPQEAMQYQSLTESPQHEGGLYFGKGIISYGFEYSHLTCDYCGTMKNMPTTLPFDYCYEGSEITGPTSCAFEGSFRKMNGHWGIAYVEGIFRIVPTSNGIETCATSVVLVKLVKARPLSPNEFFNLGYPAEGYGDCK
jgi:hypothetical protein